MTKVHKRDIGKPIYGSYGSYGSFSIYPPRPRARRGLKGKRAVRAVTAVKPPVTQQIAFTLAPSPLPRPYLARGEVTLGP